MRKTVGLSHFAPVVQWIKQLRPKEKLGVRLPPGAPGFADMNIDTPFLEQALAKYFEMPTVVRYRLMGEGQENTSVKVTLKNGEVYILRVWGQIHGVMGRRQQTDIEGELDFMVHCYEQGIQVPRVYLSRNGNRYERLPSGDDYVVMDYVAGELPVNPTPDMIRQVATAMAHMHQLAETFRYPAPRSWPGTVIEMTNERLRKLPQTPKADELMGFIEPIQRAYETELKTADLSKLPRGPIHGDIMWENIKFEGEKLQGIFDFDDCRDSYFLEDIAKTLIFDLNDAEHSFFGAHGENVTTFLDAYTAIRPLTPPESELLPFFFTVSYLYRLTRYMQKVVNGKAVYWNRIPALRERYEQNRSFFLPTA
jgi:Ser/Thr protein kinase RdoA (MazF antagonist)